MNCPTSFRVDPASPDSALTASCLSFGTGLAASLGPTKVLASTSRSSELIELARLPRRFEGPGGLGSTGFAVSARLAARGRPHVVATLPLVLTI